MCFKFKPKALFSVFAEPQIFPLLPLGREEKRRSNPGSARIGREEEERQNVGHSTSVLFMGEHWQSKRENRSLPSILKQKRSRVVLGGNRRQTLGKRSVEVAGWEASPSSSRPPCPLQNGSALFCLARPRLFPRSRGRRGGSVVARAGG